MATARLRKWGSSVGVVIPREEVRRKGLKPGDLVEVHVEPTGPSLRSVFGILKTKKSTLELIREAREGEDED